MAFEKLAFTKSWKNPEDFSTYEPDEGKVRADLQLLHDETKNSINRLVDALNAETAAAQLPIAPVAGLTAQTVQAAIEEVLSSVQDAAEAKIVNGSVTKEKLAADLLKRIYGGRMWCSLNAPTAADGPGTDLPVGQLWLRPFLRVSNLVSDQWTAEGGSAENDENGCTLTSDGSQDYVKAVQRIENAGEPGQRVMLYLETGELGVQFEDVLLYLNGIQTELEADGIYETAVDDSGTLEICLYGQLYFAEENVKLQIRTCAAVNRDALEAQFPGYEPCEDWDEKLKLLAGCSETELPLTVWLQVTAGQWQQVAHSVTPVSGGGTGLSGVEQGALLYGTGGETLAKLPPVDNGILQWLEGTPAMLTPDTFAQHNRLLRCAAGEYRGTGGTGEVTVEMKLGQAPKLVFISSLGEVPQTVCLTAGGGSSGEYLLSDGAPIVTYRAWVKLMDDKLVFSHETWGNYGGQMCSLHMNEPGVDYRWTAVCDGELVESGEENGGESAA